MGDLYAVLQKIKAAPYRKRYRLRHLAHVTVVSASMPCRMCQRDDIMATTIDNKPLRRAGARIDFIVRFVDESKLLYSPMYDVFHFDEKWIHVTRASKRI